MARERKKSANKSVQSDRNTFLNLFYFQHDAVERPFLLIEIHTHTCAHATKKIAIQRSAASCLCVLFVIEMRKLYDCKKYKGSLCRCRESAYCEPSVGIQAS